MVYTFCLRARYDWENRWIAHTREQAFSGTSQLIPVWITTKQRNSISSTTTKPISFTPDSQNEVVDWEWSNKHRGAYFPFAVLLWACASIGARPCISHKSTDIFQKYCPWSSLFQVSLFSAVDPANLRLKLVQSSRIMRIIDLGSPYLSSWQLLCLRGGLCLVNFVHIPGRLHAPIPRASVFRRPRSFRL